MLESGGHSPRRHVPAAVSVLRGRNADGVPVLTSLMPAVAVRASDLGRYLARQRIWLADLAERHQPLVQRGAVLRFAGSAREPDGLAELVVRRPSLVQLA